LATLREGAPESAITPNLFFEQVEVSALQVTPIDSSDTSARSQPGRANRLDAMTGLLSENLAVD